MLQAGIRIWQHALKRTKRIQFHERETSCSFIDEIYLVLKLQGWIFGENWSLRRKVAHGLWGVMTAIFMFALFCIHLNRLPTLLGTDDTDSIFFSLTVTPAQLAVNCYALALILLKPKMEDFKRTLQETEEIAFKHASNTDIKIYHQDCHRALIGLRIAMFGSLAGLGLWEIMPIINVAANPAKDIAKIPTSMSNYDYGLNRTTYFWFIYGFECVETCQMIVNFVIGYFTTIGLCILVKAQFSLLIRSINSAQDIFPDEAIQFGASGSNASLAINTSHSSQESKRDIFEVEFMSYIMHHQHVFRLMIKAKSMIKSVLCICFLHCTIVAANCLVVTLTEPSVRKILAAPSAFIFLGYIAILIWFMSELRTMCGKVGLVFYFLSSNVKQLPLRKYCWLIMLRSNRREKFACFIASSLTFKFFYKALEMIWNYSSFCRSMASKSTEQ